MSSSKKYVLMSFDGVTVEIDSAAAAESETIKQLIESTSDGNDIFLPNITGSILSKVVEYCMKHAEINEKDSKSKDFHPSATDEIDDKYSESKDWYTSAMDEIDSSLKTWDAEFVQVDQQTLFDLAAAADYLSIKSLIDLTCTTVAEMMRGKSIEEVREMFNIINDFTPEEEEAIRKENEWVFE